MNRVRVTLLNITDDEEIENDEVISRMISYIEYSMSYGFNLYELHLFYELQIKNIFLSRYFFNVDEDIRNQNENH